MDIDEMKVELKRSQITEARCARTIKGKALLTIDHILVNIESEDPLLCKIYRIAHSATGTCGNPHKDWLEETNKTYQTLVKAS